MEYRLADFHEPFDRQALQDLMQAYACDPMGGGEPLAESVLSVLPDRLLEFPTAYSLLAVSKTDGVSRAAGLVNCFVSLSTFKAQPIVNIHDVVVLAEFRGQGIAQKLFASVEREAKRRGACKLTLEVLEGNAVAQGLYRKLGFDAYSLAEETGRAMFWEKKI